MRLLAHRHADGDPALTPDTPDTHYQTVLAWAYSAYGSVFAFLFSLYYFSPVSGVAFALMAGAAAFVCARIAGWIAGYFGRSGYGLIACLLVAILFPSVPPLMTIFYEARDYIQTGELTCTRWLAWPLVAR